MAANTKIEWARHTFNPWIGCTKVSAGCTNCYAEEMMDKRYGKAKWGDAGSRVVTSDLNWKLPLRWDREAAAAGEKHRVFCASLADIFEEREELIPSRHRLMDLIYKTPNLIWLLLTKRSEYAYHWANMYPLFPNVWLGASVENQKAADERIPWLMATPATKRFLSMEPLLGQVTLKAFPDWVIVGGESGSNARPMHPEWARSIRKQCEGKASFFFKQWGEFGPDQAKPVAFTKVSLDIPMDEPASMFKVGKKLAGRLLDGREWNEVP